MTDQPVQGNQDGPATPQQLRAALQNALMADVDRIRVWGVEAKQRAGLLPAGLTAAHEAMWRELVNALIAKLVTDLQAAVKLLAPQSLTDAYTALTKLRHNLTTKEAASPDQVPYLQTNATYGTSVVAKVDAGLVENDKTLQDYLALIRELDATLTMFLNEAEQKAGLLQNACTVANAMLAKIGAAQISAYVGPLSGPVQVCCQAAAPMLNTTKAMFLAQVKAGLVPLVGRPKDAQSPVLTLVSDFSFQCASLRGELAFKMCYLDDDLVQALSCIPNLSQAQRTACEKYTNAYGTPWVLCLATFEAVQIGTLLQSCTYASVQKALSTKCVVGKVQPGALWKAMGLLADPEEDWQIACGKVNTMNYTQIALPGGVTGFGWIGVGAASLPRAFGVGALTTDMACLKHMVQELGASPSVDKAKRYFADLVAACQEAAKAWSAQGRPDTIQCLGIVINGVSWNIHVRSRFGKPEVFHVDSGYANSPWVKQA